MWSQYFEAGLALGASNYYGELQNQVVQPSEYNLALSAFGRYNMNSFLAFKMHLVQAKVSGMDANATLIVDQQRNLSFRSDILEVGIQAEINIVPYHIPARKIAAPYLFVGAAGFYFNPQAQIRGEWHDLQPLGTEGQGLAEYQSLNKYKLLQIAIPFGLGFKFNINDRTNIGVELGVRKTFTDYLDDVGGFYPDINLLDPLAADLSYREPENLENSVSNPMGLLRGDPANKDWYMVGLISLSFNLTDTYGLDFDDKYQIFKEPKEEVKENPDDF